MGVLLTLVGVAVVGVATLEGVLVCEEGDTVRVMVGTELAPPTALSGDVFNGDFMFAMETRACRLTGSCEEEGLEVATPP